MLRVAVPNKGSLSEPAERILSEAGYPARRDGKQLTAIDEQNGIHLFFLRPRDIAVYVGAGTLHAGITGRDLLLDARVAATEVMGLGFARSTFRFAARPGTASSLADMSGLRVATSYSHLVADYLARHHVDAPVWRLDGAVEGAVELGVADVIADVVQTGSTLRAAGLEVFGEPILESEAVLIRAEGQLDAEVSQALTVLGRRLNGVLVARKYVLMDYDIRVELLESAVEITPGLESPTVSPLADPQWVAVRAMVERRSTNAAMDKLYALGARAILVTTIHACRM
ncbi:MAG: ATP phosphoribosyltransferase [Micrococcales bacterium]|nr:MAG: ATP phosphoribosyltransferase [Micrococcales bacterium]PIE26780.1 MAG: ATP phosphoribosyltransferase [Micrococcales bacterium]